MDISPHRLAFATLAAIRGTADTADKIARSPLILMSQGGMDGLMTLLSDHAHYIECENDGICMHAPYIPVAPPSHPLGRLARKMSYMDDDVPVRYMSYIRTNLIPVLKGIILKPKDQ